MGLTEIIRSLGERAHEGSNVRRIRQHANQYVVPSDTTNALFVVHPYFNRQEENSVDEELSKELEEAKRFFQNTPKTRKASNRIPVINDGAFTPTS